MRRQRNIRAVDDDAWEMMIELRDQTRKPMGALIGEAVALLHAKNFRKHRLGESHEE